MEQDSNLEMRSAELNKSEQKLQLLANNSLDLIYRYTILPERGFDYVSPGAERITGYTPEEFYTNPALAYTILHPEDKWVHNEKKISTNTNELSEPVQFRMYHKNGNIIHVEKITRVNFDEDGNIVSAEGVLRDITEYKKSEERLKILHEVAVGVLKERPIHEILHYLCQSLVDISNNELAWVGLKEIDGSVNIRAKAGRSAAYVEGLSVRWDNSPQGNGPIGTSIKIGRVVTCEVEDATFAPWLARAKGYDIKSIIVVPLKLKEETIGALSIYSNKVGFWNKKVVEQLEYFAEQVAVVLNAAFTTQQVTLLNTTLQSAANAIAITDMEGRYKWVNNAFLKISKNASLEELGINNNSIMNSIDEAAKEEIAASISNGQTWSGQMYLNEKDGKELVVEITSTPVADETGKLVNVINIMQDITYRVDAEKTIAKLSYNDHLTDLPNRQLFHELLKLAVTAGKNEKTGFSLIIINIDRFKLVNDSMGHAVGDKFLLEVVNRLQRICGSENTIARLGSDEFAILLADKYRAEEVASFVERIRSLLASTWEICGQVFPNTASIGVAFYPGDGTDHETLLRNCDTALHRAKEQGGNRFQFYTSSLNEKILKQMFFENGLRKAIENSELALFYQPIYNVQTGRFTSAEALLRWQHPQIGLISPLDFIPVAEDTGLIIPIGEWVIQEACRQNKEWHDAGFDDLKVGVNLSTKQFAQENLVNVISSSLEKTGLEAKYFTIEITESITIMDVELTRETLDKLRKMGVTIAVDDFGTGYSSLNYLKRFSIDKIKIDRSFIKDLLTNSEDEAIVKAIIAMTHGLNLGVIAEGVENEEQLQFLIAQGCDMIQGYFYSRPLPAEKFFDFIKSKKA